MKKFLTFILTLSLLTNHALALECNHMMGNHEDISQRREATCTQPGQIVYVCNTCGRVVDVKYTEPLGHDWTDYIATDDSLKHFRYCKREKCDEEYDKYPITSVHTFEELYQKPTCTEDGYVGKYCIDCGYKEIETLYALGHDTVIITVDEPTCTEKGNSYEQCTICGSVLSSAEQPALGHDWSEWITTTEPTCITAGTAKRECQREGCNANEEKILPELGHTWTETWEFDANNHWHICETCSIHEADLPHVFSEWAIVREATVETEGLQQRICQDCEYTEEQLIDKLPYTPPIVITTRYYNLTIHYVDELNNTIAPTITYTYEQGEAYNITSPIIDGYIPDIEIVEGILNRNRTITVIYSTIEVEDEELEEADTPLSELPEIIKPEEEEEILIEEEEEALEEQDTPLTELPDIEEVEETTPPLADVPQTGDNITIYYTFVLLSALGLIALKKDDKE